MREPFIWKCNNKRSTTLKIKLRISLVQVAYEGCVAAMHLLHRDYGITALRVRNKVLS